MALVIQAERVGGTTLRKGDVFAQRYTIVALLGRGGMGAVYVARDLALGEIIALKLLGTEFEPAPVEVLRFREEVRLARRVTHPNVARVYDIGEEAGVLYLTMELIEGEDLRTLLRREGRLPPPRAARMARALCEGLSAAHAAGVVHRDLKPANVLVGTDDRVVIVDFGVARSLTDAHSLTVGVVGTPSYMAPEQLTGSPVDGRTDLYALGLVLHEMLTGVRPDTGPGALDALGLPALAALVRQCLDHVPERRPASAAEVSHLLALALPEPAAGPGTQPPAAGVELAVLPTAEPDLRPDAGGSGVVATPVLCAPRPSMVETGTTPARALAVLPFRYRGPPDHDDMGDAITDDLVDVLSRTHRLRVLGSGATARYRDVRDPRAVGAELGAGAVVDGAVQLGGDKVRITVRLLETAGGVQIWSERYEGDLADLLAFQETVARRVAEALRVELTTLAHRGDAPAEAIEQYDCGRRKLRAYDAADSLAAVACLDRCLELAPDFAPALAAHALASLRAWYYVIDDVDKDWEAAARASTDRAVTRAPELAETHLAAGIRATNYADYRAAVCSLESALKIAPTYAAAHEYLGMLQCEAGRGKEGARRLEHAIALDPTLMRGGFILSRTHALAGRFDRCELALADVDRRIGLAARRLTAAARVRMAAWRGDGEDLRRWATELHHQDAMNWRFMSFYAQALVGEIGEDGLRQGFAQVIATAQNPRFLSFAAQLAAEVYAALGRADEARLHVMRAATSVLVDLEWLDGCPLLAELRKHPDYPDLRRRVRVRAEAIWAT
jgi:serine/threonine-protein kinase